jgi:hypothetical protein
MRRRRCAERPNNLTELELEMNRKLLGNSVLGLVLAGGLVSQNAFADPPRDFDRGHDRAYDRAYDRGHDRHWRGDIHRFQDRDMAHWRGGRWHRGRHDGRLGWWWVVGGVWYLYSAPVYPYPDPYQPPVVMVEQPSVSAAPVYAPPPTQLAEPVAAPTPSQYWYYCEEPAGYYPYVSQCPRAWQKVPATPAR